MSKSERSIYNYTAVFEKEKDGGYHANGPALKGCHSQGDSIEETPANITEAIELYIESLKADREPIPENNFIIQQICVSA